MKPASRPWPLCSFFLMLAGATLVGTGLYFVVLRPALLPEDIRYMNLSAMELAAIGPRLRTWLTHVFLVLGGYILATGALAIALAATSFRELRWGAAIGAFIGGVASIGLMAVVNFTINSDFKWVLLAMALIWAFSLGLFWFEKKNASD